MCCNQNDIKAHWYLRETSIMKGYVALPEYNYSWEEQALVSFCPF